MTLGPTKAATPSGCYKSTVVHAVHNAKDESRAEQDCGSASFALLPVAVWSSGKHGRRFSKHSR